MRRHDKQEANVRYVKCVVLSHFFCHVFAFLPRKLKKKQNHEDTAKSNFVMFSHFCIVVFWGESTTWRISATIVVCSLKR